MAGRKEKRTIDFFPHQVNSGKTISTLERKFGNDGYSFWFRLLELLGKTQDHYYDFSSPEAWEYLLGLMIVNDKKARDIIRTLVNLNAIHPELWNNHKVIYSENFVKNIKAVYDKRDGAKLPDLQYVYEKLGIIKQSNSDSTNTISDSGNTIDDNVIHTSKKHTRQTGDGKSKNSNDVDDSISDNRNAIPDSKNTIPETDKLTLKKSRVKEIKEEEEENKDDLPLLRQNALNLFSTKWNRNYKDDTELNKTIEAIRKHGLEKLTEAFKTASLRDKRSVGYVLGILNNNGKSTEDKYARAI